MFLEIEAVSRILRATTSQRDNLIVRFLLLGLRPSEVAALRAGDIDVEQCRVRIDEAAPSRGGLKATKTAASRGWVPMPSALSAEIAVYLDVREWALMTSSFRGEAAKR